MENAKNQISIKNPTIIEQIVPYQRKLDEYWLKLNSYKMKQEQEVKIDNVLINKLSESTVWRLEIDGKHQWLDFQTVQNLKKALEKITI